MNLQRTISFYTLGCKLNFAETASISRLAGTSGYQVLPPETKAQIAVINTCSVTDNADQKCRKLVKKILESAADTQIVVIGCYAQLKPDEIMQIDGVRLVLGAAEKFDLVARLKDLDNEPGFEVKQPALSTSFHSNISGALPFHTSWSSSERTRSFLKVQDGCNYSCSFCTIPLARGKSRNGSIEEICNAAAEIAQTGIHEIVLTGVNIGDFGKTTNETFISLITALEHVNGIDRFRISSIEPNLLSREIIKFVAISKKFVPHFHLPLQSGSNRILGAMKRRYQRDLYASRVVHIKERIPSACIGADVIVGFPGETEEDFQDSYQFIQGLGLSYLHIFSYSARADTPAAASSLQVANAVKASRSRILHALSKRLTRSFYESQLGKRLEVMFEQENKGGFLFGYTANYVKVCRPFDPAYVKDLTHCTLSHIHDNGAVLIKS